MTLRNPALLETGFLFDRANLHLDTIFYPDQHLYGQNVTVRTVMRQPVVVRAQCNNILNGVITILVQRHYVMTFQVDLAIVLDEARLAAPLASTLRPGHNELPDNGRSLALKSQN